MDHNSPVLYAVQFRDMHTAIHNIIIYQSLLEARAALRSIKEEETTGAAPLCEDQIEIDYRNPPAEYGGHPLTIINGGEEIPDCY